MLSSGLNGILYGLIIMVGMLMAFSEVSKRLCMMENYRTEAEFQDQWIMKMFFFIYIDGPSSA